MTLAARDMMSGDDPVPDFEASDAFAHFVDTASDLVSKRHGALGEFLIDLE